MNPNTPTPSFELPTPLPAPNSEAGALHGEQSAVLQETYINPPVSGAVPVQQQAAIQPMPYQQPTHPIAQSTSQLPASGSPITADDADLIEKEWVLKAKQIVAATRNDPHMQNKEIGRFKAEYLKKRYNKDIKIEES